RLAAAAAWAAASAAAGIIDPAVAGLVSTPVVDRSGPLVRDVTDRASKATAAMGAAMAARRARSRRWASSSASLSVLPGAGVDGRSAGTGPVGGGAAARAGRARGARGRRAAASLPVSLPLDRHAILVATHADDQGCRVEEAVHHVVRESNPVVHERRLAAALHQQSRRLACLERSRHLDVNVLSIVEDADRSPR